MSLSAVSGSQPHESTCYYQTIPGHTNYQLLCTVCGIVTTVTLSLSLFSLPFSSSPLIFIFIFIHPHSISLPIHSTLFILSLFTSSFPPLQSLQSLHSPFPLSCPFLPLIVPALLLRHPPVHTYHYCYPPATAVSLGSPPGPPPKVPFRFFSLCVCASIIKTKKQETKRKEIKRKPLVDT